MIQRYLYDIIDAGIEAVKVDNTLLDDIFTREYALDTTEVAAIKTYFAASPPKVYNGYQQTDSEYPAILVTLGREGEDIHFMGDFAEQVLDSDDPLYRADIKSEVWSHTYDILIYAQHIDIAQYYYELVKTILLSNHDDMIDKGLFNFSMTGSELAPDPNFTPQHYLFLRRITFSCKREFQFVDRESLKYKGTRITGLHIDSSGSTGEVEGVDTHVTPYIEDE